MRNASQKLFSIVFFFTLLGALNVYGTDLYTTQLTSSTVRFKVSHFGVAFVKGRFEKFSGAFTFEGDRLTHFSGTVDMTSLDTGILRRDEDLKSDNFFAAKKFPTMTIDSKEVIQTGSDITIESNLTIRDITKLVKLHGKINRFDGTKAANVFLQGTINRKDFGLRLNKIYEIFVGDHVTIFLKLQATYEKNDTHT